MFLFCHRNIQMYIAIWIYNIYIWKYFKILEILGNTSIDFYLRYCILQCECVELICKSTSTKTCHQWILRFVLQYHSFTLFCILEFLNVFWCDFIRKSKILYRPLISIELLDFLSNWRIKWYNFKLSVIKSRCFWFFNSWCFNSCRFWIWIK